MILLLEKTKLPAFFFSHVPCSPRVKTGPSILTKYRSWPIEGRAAALPCLLSLGFEN